jgi:hypothetical protein
VEELGGDMTEHEKRNVILLSQCRELKLKTVEATKAEADTVPLELVSGIILTTRQVLTHEA